MMDPNFVKLFKLSQLIIEYLLHSQNYLTELISGLETQVSRSSYELEETKKVNEKLEKEVVELKKENKKNKRLIEKQQLMINPNNANYHSCAYCSKAFVNLNYLQMHISRRHSQMPQHQISEYEKEIDKLKEKLQHTESELLVQKSSRTSQITTANQEDVFLSKMEDWKNEQNRRQKEEIGSISDKFLKEMKELNNKNGHLEKIVEDLQAKLGKPSNVNWIKDDVDLTKDMFLQQQSEFEKLRKEFIDYRERKGNEKDDIENRYSKALKKMERDLDKKNSMISDLSSKAEYPKRQPEIQRVPPPVMPRNSERSPSPMKPVMAEPKQPLRNSVVVENMYLGDYCPLTQEKLNYESDILTSAKDAIKRFLNTQLDDMGIYPREKGLSDNDYRLKVNELKIARDENAAKLPHFTQMRKEFSDLCLEYCKQKLTASLRSSASGNRVTFDKNLVKKKPQPKLSESDNEELSEVSIPNAVESNDDDTEPTKPNPHYSSSKRSAILKPILENFTKNKHDNRRADEVASSREEETENKEEISELESVTQIQDVLVNSATGSVQQKKKAIEKQIEGIMKKDAKPGSNVVSIGFSPKVDTKQKQPIIRKDEEDAYSDISSIDANEVPRTKANQHQRPPTQQSLDTSTNTSMWAPASHNGPNNSHVNHNDRPQTANSAVTSNFDSDEY